VLKAAPLARATMVRAKIEAALLPLAPLWLLPLLALAAHICGSRYHWRYVHSVQRQHRSPAGPPTSRETRRIQDAGQGAPGKGSLKWE